MSIFVTVGLSWILTFAASILSPWPYLREIMIVLTTLITPLQGFFIFIAYCINKKVQHKWRGLFAKIPGCGCCAPPKSSGGTGRGKGTRTGYSSSTKTGLNSKTTQGRTHTSHSQTRSRDNSKSSSIN